jgi:hypothetical protein
MPIIALYIPTNQPKTISLVEWETKQYQTDIRGNLVYQFLELQPELQPIETPQARGLTPQTSPTPKKKKGGCNCKK